MKTAFEQAREWGIVPKFVPTPEDREKARDAYRLALRAMGREYRMRVRTLRRPPRPGPRPEAYEGMPPFPEAVAQPKGPVLIDFPETDADFEANREALEKISKLMERASDQEKKILVDFQARNDEWLDTVFFPGEAERHLWEVASSVCEEWDRARRARSDLRYEKYGRWLPVAAYVAIGIAALTGAAYVILAMVQ